jgi:hypothetical protein
MLIILIAQVFFAVIAFYAANSLIHFVIEDALDLAPEYTLLFGYEYGRCLSYMIVSSVSFLVIMHLRRHLPTMFVLDKKKENKAYFGILIASSSFCALYSTRLLYLYLSGRTDTGALLNITTTVCVLIIGTLYFLLEKKDVKNSNFKVYAAAIYGLWGVFLGGGITAIHIYAPPAVLRKLNNDLLLIDTARQIGVKLKKALKARDIEKITLQELLSFLTDREQQYITGGEFTYKNEGSNAFSLSFQLKTKLEELRKIKRLTKLNRRYTVFLEGEIKLNSQSVQRINTLEYKLDENK